MQPDVIIIGGGVIGAACAYFLSGRGAKVLVLERGHLGAGASGTTAAIISISGSSGTPEPLRPLNVEGYHLILEIAQGFERPLEVIHAHQAGFKGVVSCGCSFAEFLKLVVTGGENLRFRA